MFHQERVVCLLHWQAVDRYHSVLALHPQIVQEMSDPRTGVAGLDPAVLGAVQLEEIHEVLRHEEVFLPPDHNPSFATLPTWKKIVKRKNNQRFFSRNLPRWHLDAQAAQEVLVDEEVERAGEDMSLIRSNETGIHQTKNSELLGRALAGILDLLNRLPFELKQIGQK